MTLKIGQQVEPVGGTIENIHIDFGLAEKEGNPKEVLIAFIISYRNAADAVVRREIVNYNIQSAVEICNTLAALIGHAKQGMKEGRTVEEIVQLLSQDRNKLN